MNTDQFERLVQGAEETTTLDFKGPMEWSVKSFIKDILAMSNMTDGGRLVIGVEDETYARLSLNDAQVETFNPGIMRDQIAPFADPSVSFSRSVVTGIDKKVFIVIEIRPFKRDVVICKRNQYDVHEGRIYYRTRVGRPKSSCVSNSVDMREILELAIGRNMEGLRRVNIIRDQVPFDFDAELGDLA